MAMIAVVGAGMNGLTTAMLLARDGHEVTVLERDAAAPPPAPQAWDHWERQGVGQFRQLHFMLSRWRQELEESLPDVLDDLEATGGLRFNPITTLPEQRRGAVRPDDDRFETVTARRPVLEAVLAAAAARTPGLDVRRGTAVTGFVAGEPASPGVPHVAGVRIADGGTILADLVVDCRGRRARLADWLAGIGAQPPAEEREEAGFVYYGRHFRSADGRPPAALAPLLQHYAPFTVVTLPADNGRLVRRADHQFRRPPAAGTPRSGGLAGRVEPVPARGALGVTGPRRRADHRRRRHGRARGPAPPPRGRRRTRRHRPGPGG